MSEIKKPEPISDTYHVGRGYMARLFTDGWHCTCYKPDCEHIEEAKKQHAEVTKTKQAEASPKG